MSQLLVYLLRRVRCPRVHGRTGRVLGGRLRGGGHGRAPRHVRLLLGRLLGPHLGTQSMLFLGRLAVISYQFVFVVIPGDEVSDLVSRLSSKTVIQI